MAEHTGNTRDTGQELLHSSERTQVTREARATGHVIRKQARGPGAAARVRDELKVLRRLRGVPGVEQLIDEGSGGSDLVFEDSGRIRLATVVGDGLPTDRLVALAEELARIVAAVHRAGVVHRDLNPANILARPDGSEPLLIDFDAATTFAEERPEFTHHSEIIGTLAYLAPEQSGRTGRPVDHRADLYALGATLYELATGTPPFGSGLGDPLALVHAHLARVPEPPETVNPAIPPVLSRIILRLLEKEADRRYQSADGLVHDLSLLRAAGDPNASFPLGTRDFPLRLAPPSRLVGRDAEIAVLRDAFRAAIGAPGPRGLLVSGVPGVGKTALLDELRPQVTASGGWFVTGKSDRQDRGSDAVVQALRGLGRLLLAEPEDDLDGYRRRLLAALGPSAGLVADLLPEFSTLLRVPPNPSDGDPASAAARTHQACVALLAAVASPDRPVVVVLDDLQWASTFTLGCLDAILTDDRPSGVLLVGSYRDVEVGPTHPLAAMISRWERLALLPPPLRLTNLPADDVATFLASMLRLAPGGAGDLADAVTARATGNPFDTVELANALRRDGVLAQTEDGWTWDVDAIRRFVGAGDVVELLTARIDRLPAPTVELLRTVACLGGEVSVALLALLRPELDEELAPALEDGLLVRQHQGDATVAFRHDRVRQAAYAGLPPDARRARHLGLARALAAGGQDALAAEQYLPGIDDVTEPGEQRQVAGLLRAAAAQASRVADYEVAETYLGAAARLLAAAGDDTDLPARIAVQRHAALVGLGRLDEADRVFAEIQAGADPWLRATAAAIQVSSLTSRGMLGDALGLGAATLAEAGRPIPAGADLLAEIGRGLDLLQTWAAGSGGRDLERAENPDSRAHVVADVINRMVPAAFFAGSELFPWLVTEAGRMWIDGGPAASLVGPLAHAAFVTVPLRDDYRTGYDVVRRVMAEARARNYEPYASQALFLHALGAAAWLEDLGDTVRYARDAREGLVRGGDLWNACFTYFASVYHSMDAAASLEESAAEVEQALAFADRTGNAFVTASMTVYRQITRALRGETSAPGSLTDASFADDDFVASLGPNQTAAANYHSARAVVAAVFGDLDALDTHSAATLGLLPFVDVTQVCAQGRLQRCLALARRARRADPADREPMLAEFAGHRDWLARRADEAPVNFGHVRTWLDAERAWASGDLDQALRGFDTAQREVTTRSRPLHRAMIAESRARCQLDGGLEHGGRQALAEARQLYLDWGATGKVTELEREFPFLRGARTTWANEGPRTFHATMGTGGSSDALDILALLRATQALASETDLTRLRDRVGEVLTAMTGATAVRLLLRDHDSNDWFLPDPDGGGVPVTDAAEGGLVPLTAFRYAERTGEPLVIPDAVHDDRFARDPYLQGLDECALLVVPILARGAPRGMLLLENRLARGAFSPDRIDAVMLVAGQLAVSLENALAERFRSLVQRSADLTLVCNRQGVISYASAAAIELAGVRETHLLGRAAVDLVPAEDRAGLLERLARVTPGLPETMTCRVVRAGGPHRWADVTITDLTGEPAVGGLMLHLRDVTERQRLEAELRHAQKLESVGQLSAGIAHEINTPIQFMTANLAFLTEAFQDLTGDAGAPAAADDELADLLTEIPQAIADTLEGAERVATIVRAMKAFGDAGDEDRTDVDLNEAIRNTLVVAAAELRDVADVETELGELPPAWCTPGDVNQILLNLVLNAAQAIGDAVAGTDRRGTLTVRSRQADGDVVVEVEDTGTGISPEIADRVFDQFFTTRPEGAGTGQGLSLAHTLVVDRYGGTITFESMPGTGTTFTVRLPTRA